MTSSQVQREVIMHGRMSPWFAAFVCVGFLAVGSTALLVADDWPEFRGKGRLGVWTETGIVDVFPANGLPVKWRTPINAGYSGASVANGRVFITDARRIRGHHVVERAIAIEENSGKILWTRDWETDYDPMVQSWALGPVASPTIDAERVYVLGRMGDLLALDVQDGRVLWKKDYVKEFDASIPLYGFVGAPVVDGDRVIAVVGGEGEAKVVAFNKLTGVEVWRALKTEGEPGYGQPIIVEAGGARQLLLWHGTAISSLDPATGRVYWEVPFSVDLNLTIATPVRSGPYVFVASHYNGSRLLKLDETKPGATQLWASDLSDDTINPASSTPVIDGDYVYGLNGFGVLRCLDLKTGKRVWETRALLKEHAMYATALFVRNGDRYFINNDRGELVMAKLSPKGYEEISRTHVITPTHPGGRRRELQAVNWSYPAYANKHIIVRNDNEIVRYSLAQE